MIRTHRGEHVRDYNFQRRLVGHSEGFAGQLKLPQAGLFPWSEWHSMAMTFPLAAGTP